MQEIKIKLWHHPETLDWSIEVTGILYDHVKSATVYDLVDYALVVAQESLSATQIPTGSTLASYRRV